MASPSDGQEHWHQAASVYIVSLLYYFAEVYEDRWTRVKCHVSLKE